MQNAQVRIRVSQDNSEFLKELSEAAGIGQVDVATMLLHSALKALRDAGKTAAFPIKFSIVADPNRASGEVALTEPRPAASKGRH